MKIASLEKKTGLTISEGNKGSKIYHFYLNDSNIFVEVIAGVDDEKDAAEKALIALAHIYSNIESSYYGLRGGKITLFLKRRFAGSKGQTQLKEECWYQR